VEGKPMRQKSEIHWFLIFIDGFLIDRRRRRR